MLENSFFALYITSKKTIASVCLIELSIKKKTTQGQFTIQRVEAHVDKYSYLTYKVM